MDSFMDINLRLIIVVAAAITIVGTGAIYYFAVLNKPVFTVTVQVTGNGRVLLGSTGAYATILQVNGGDTVQLSAIPDPGWKFSEWSGDLSGNTNPAQVFVTKDLKITAVFTK
jgi:hypothetical protein